MSGVSVVIPAWNPGEALFEAINSVLGQPDIRAQIVVVDDGSNIPVQSILETHFPGLVNQPNGETLPRIDCVRQENQGAYIARLNGLQICNQPMVKFLDQDDVLLDAALAREAAAMSHDVDIVMSNWQVEALDGSTRSLFAPVYEDPISDFLRFGGCYTSAALYRTELAQRVLRPVEDFVPVKADDWMIFAQMIVAGARCTRVNLFSYCWKQSPDQLSRTSSRRLVDEHYLILDWIERELEDSGELTPSRRSLLANYYAKELLTASAQGAAARDRLLARIHALQPDYRQQHGNPIYRLLCNTLGLETGVRTYSAIKALVRR